MFHITDARIKGLRKLIHYSLVLFFCTSWKHQKTYRFSRFYITESLVKIGKNKNEIESNVNKVPVNHRNFREIRNFYKHNIFLLDSVAECHQKNVWEKHNPPFLTNAFIFVIMWNFIFDSISNLIGKGK